MTQPESPEDRLAALGIVLPTPAAPAANYVPAVRAGGLLFLAGQLPMGPDGLAFRGKLGRELTVEQGREAARLAAINLIAQAKMALGRLDRVRQVARLTGFVSGIDSFTEPHKVLDGASELFVAVFGDRGRHTRSVLVAASMPLNSPILIDAILEAD